ncbi:Uma2 family endonuclease [Polyangium mundeleinium]|uniref:Uma2 family endonuclease n=1 Tax=Polyangium mundeleinium TaxID=2995306 RepID=A0ABT5F2T9_9BACT|nr:Uma2 family endonuclease [Polyangium mundeleinium]MDC0748416.1 Uma2 family endonuclease [Polyangium mundeleinium]
MAEPAGKLKVTFAEYLALEEGSETKHEFLDGQIYDMAGGTPNHGLLAGNVARALGNQLEGRPCRVHPADVRIRVQATGLSTYPDVSVVCGQLQVDAEDKNGVVNPIVLVEVLSESTEAYDRGMKFTHYRRIPSLREYVLVSHKTKQIEVYRRADGGAWILHEAQSGSIDLESIGCSLSVDAVYRGAFEVPELVS